LSYAPGFGKARLYPVEGPPQGRQADLMPASGTSQPPTKVSRFEPRSHDSEIARQFDHSRGSLLAAAAVTTNVAPTGGVPLFLWHAGRSPFCLEFRPFARQIVT